MIDDWKLGGVVLFLNLLTEGSADQLTIPLKKYQRICVACLGVVSKGDFFIFYHFDRGSPIGSQKNQI